ncbi:MAG: ABC transporter substrate-binding protein, partial [Chloroflexi bacterium]|nr:ABC transporter substrate-binding protein [Chloroflexota bacterium]
LVEPETVWYRDTVKYHVNKFPLWEKAKYGGERLGTSAFNLGGLINPFTTAQRRTVAYGMLLLTDVGTCSLLGRTDFSKCNGVRTNNLAGVLVPGIVERWERPDPLTTFLYIRRGVLWPSIPPMTRPDRTVTAEDIKWYMETQKKEGIFKDTFAQVDTFEVVDRFTLKLKFSEPHATFILMLANAGLGIVPKECYDDKPGCLSKRIISPGPFILDESSFTARVQSTVVRNEEFWLKGLPYLDRMRGVAITDPAAQRAAFITGKTDHIGTPSPTEREVLAKQTPKARIQAVFCSCGSDHFLVRLDKKPWDDVRVRRAISMAMDREKAWTVANDGFNAIGMPMAFNFLGIDRFVSLKGAGPYNQFNPTEAKRLLKEAGYESGFSFPVWNYWTSYGTQEILLSIKEDLKKVLNVDMEIKQIETAAWFSKTQVEKNWEGGMYSVCYDCNASDPDSFLLMAYSKSPRNVEGINDPIIDEIYLKARRELDDTKRTALYWDFVNRMYDQAYAFHFGNPSGFEHFAPWLMNAVSHIFAYAHVHNFTSWVQFVDPDQIPK